MDSLPKIIAIDANVLVCLCEESGDRKEKIDHLIAQLDKSKGRVVIPTPSIAEFLVHADQAGLGMLEAVQRRSSVFVASFDLRKFTDGRSSSRTQ
jgi:predicted nucleic acid-binding protein